MERQAIQSMMVNVTGQLLPAATLPVVQSAEPHRPRPRAYSPAQVRAVAARQDERNALATEIAHASGIRANELLTLGRPEEQPPDGRRDRSHLTGTATEGMKYAGRRNLRDLDTIEQMSQLVMPFSRVRLIWADLVHEATAVQPSPCPMTDRECERSLTSRTGSLGWQSRPSNAVGT